MFEILQAYAFGWQLGPRINAAGRIGSPILAYRLLETKDEEEAAKLAKQLDDMNKDRQALIEKAVNECLKMYDGSTFPVFACKYPHGVVGIVAGNIANKIRRPVIVGSIEDGMVRASGRSIGEFSILNALQEAHIKHGIPKKFGGHKKACGLEVEYEQLPKLQKALNEIAKEKLTVEDITEWINIDGVISSVPSVEEVEELDNLEPFGEENPEPVFALSGPVDWIKRGESWQMASVCGIKFFTTTETELIEGQKIHLAVSPYVNEYNGEREVMARVKDIKETVLTRCNLIRSFRDWRKGKEIREMEEAVFKELGFSRTGKVVKSNLITSKTFRKYGAL